MAIVKISLTNTQWTLISNSDPFITFQNSGSFPIYINFTSNNTAPTDNVGLIYGPREGEMKKYLTDMTKMSNPTHVWAKSVAKVGSIIVEQ
jgi:hypothetical protein